MRYIIIACIIGLLFLIYGALKGVFLETLVFVLIVVFIGLLIYLVLDSIKEMKKRRLSDNSRFSKEK